jgi:hypothetical protein
MFKQTLAILAIALVMVTESKAQQAGPPAPNTEQTAKIRKHTGLKFATMQPLSSTTAHVGDDVLLRLASPLVLNGATVLPAGEVVHAKVVKVKKATQHCHSGEIKLNLDEISFADSSKAKVKVWSISPDPNAYVPSRLTSSLGFTEGGLEIDNWWEAVLATPLFALMIVAYSPFLVLVPFALLSPCNVPGKELELPVNSVVAVQVKQDHKVRF